VSLSGLRPTAVGGALSGNAKEVAGSVGYGLHGAGEGGGGEMWGFGCVGLVRYGWVEVC
jgi:hypothetical protein